MSEPRWYLYTHKATGGLATSLTPPTEQANIDAYEWTGPHRDADIINKFVEIHNANCKAKRSASDKPQLAGGSDPVEG